MDKQSLENLLKAIKEDKVSINDALEELTTLPFTDLGYAKIDNHRELRNGYPEVIYCEGKSTEQVVGIIENMLLRNENILATRATEEMYNAVLSICDDAKFNKLGRTITIEKSTKKVSDSYIAIVTAGTSDIPVAEEAAITCEIFGNRVERVYDVGVAGIHRLFDRLDILRGAKVLIVIAGMEGALASVVGGLVDKPIIAVPTSVGYGAHFNGLAPLLTMLNSCASGVTVVNIDNGFGAAYTASMINKL
ncbi:nickel pincer cofactor biosynthesis protein LarB [Clostridium sardiniense]|uniref:Nickel pincer cofactor biosynthesis protein LarB n=1 Tax=Clostridium sardiniense TaxID=29369 RepID=A0ABS7KX68_CLOSR|nr:nickel pincer cofactor biosynthesis protein LarB [Clostridium sardiniense]MBY0755414.1 nickel pincer cofactor biosynthesis protein LarB [Clostridium sardiniense]MDQ0459862.1 NCAIR mutase (PurE)-related protein [Clostridium sardiniense]